LRTGCSGEDGEDDINTLIFLIIYTHHEVLLGGQITEKEMGGTGNMHGVMRNA
jgi:hypothetical protein